VTPIEGWARPGWLLAEPSTTEITDHAYLSRCLK
jgi:hypothetical protein